MKILSKTILLFCFAFVSLPVAGQNAARLARETTIYRDTYGVPHVFCERDAGCVFGYVFAQAEDNFWQIEDNYIRAVGRSAEIYGESALQSDLMNRALEISRLSKAEYERSDFQMKLLYDAAAAGLNYYLAKNPAVKPRLISRFEPWHVLAYNRFMLYQYFIVRRMNLKYEDWQSATAAIALEFDESFGSNTWAIASSKSAAGAAMLFTNPHLPFFGAGQFYEGHLKSASGWEISGCSFFGSPFVITGFNQNLGWAHTVNNPDVADLYIEKFSDDKLSYLYEGKQRAATSWTEEVGVKSAGAVEKRKISFAKTHHGAIISRRGTEAVALKMAKLSEGEPLRQWYEMGRARNLGEFKRAMARLDLPFLNAAYADDAGNIFYLYNGAVPRRSIKFDWSKPVDGATAETEWREFHTLEELPQVLNPPSGFIQNCNTAPFVTTNGAGNPDSQKFPNYMVREGDNARARISRKILSEKSKFTFDEWTNAATDTRVGEAENYLPALFDEWEKLRQADAPRAEKTAEAVGELKKWNQVSTIDSVAMTLFVRWLEQVLRQEKAEPANFSRVAKLEFVLSELEKDWQTWRVAWGEVNRLQRIEGSGETPFSDERISLPTAGAGGEVGIVFNFGTRAEKGQKRRYGTGGNTYSNVVEFRKTGARARSIVVFGANAEPNSPHYFDQARLYAQGKFKPVWLALAEIKANLESSYRPGERLQKER